MRIVFIGAVEFSLHALEHLLTMNVDVVGVCTLQDSKFNADHADLKVVSEAHGIPWVYADNINSPEILAWIRTKIPDVIFCFGWSRLLKQEILGLAPLGVVGFHPAALPANRGRHPIIWALVLGLKETASTYFLMDVGTDSGDIISQQRVIIGDEDDAGTLYQKITHTALKQMESFVPKLASGKFQRVRQNQEQANTWRKRGGADGKIDWRMSARSIHNLVRGLTKPYVGAHFVFEGREIRVWKAAVVKGVSQNIEPGKVLTQMESKPVVKCGEDAICLLVAEPTIDVVVGSYLES
jgi:methionyl-tRNA formyltransferase